MAHHDLTVPAERVVDGDYDFASGMRAADRLRARADRPTAIFACNDEMAAGVAWTAHRLGVAVPDELAIAGFDWGKLVVPAHCFRDGRADKGRSPRLLLDGGARLRVDVSQVRVQYGPPGTTMTCPAR